MKTSKSLVFLRRTGLILGLVAVSFLPRSARADFGYALDFDGAGAFVGTPPINLGAVNAATFELWVKPASLTSAPYMELTRQEQSGFGPDWLLAFQLSGTVLSFGLKTTAGYHELHVAIQPSDFADGNWHHIAAVYDGTQKTVYRDGVQIGAASESGNLSLTGATNAIGASMVPNPGEFFVGTIDEVRVWTIARSSADIASDKSTVLTGLETGLKAYYKFDEGAGGITADSTPNGYTGTLVGNANWVASTVGAPAGISLATLPPSNLTTNSATLNGTANLAGDPASAYFRYGPDTNYGSLTATQDFSGVSGSVLVSNTVSNLTPGRQYHYRLVVETNGVAATGRDRIFFTSGIGSGTALSFAPSNYVTVPAVNVSASNRLTLEAWIKPANLTGTPYSDIIRQQGASNPDWLFGFQNSGTVLAFGLKVASGNYQELHVSIDPNSLGDGGWHHMAAVYDGTNRLVYVDGAVIGTGTGLSGNVAFTSSLCGIGANVASPVSEFFNGTIDEVRIWGVGRAISEINQTLLTELLGSEPGLAAYYRFDDGGGTQAVDCTGNNRNGTLVNGPGWVISTAPLIAQPAALSGVATNVKTNGATFNGTIYPSGTQALAFFSFGLATNYTAQTTGQPVIGGTNPQKITNSMAGLLPGAQYHFRIASSNNSGVIVGLDRQFFTAGTAAGNALAFNGSNSYVRLPVYDLSAGSNLTLEVWIKPGDLTLTATSTLLRQQAFSTTDWRLAFANNGNTLVFGLRTGSTYSELLAPVNPFVCADGNWHHIAATYDGIVQKLYLDGVLIGTQNKTGKIAFTATNNSMGADNNGVSATNFFNGQMDDARIWNTPRSASEISQYLNQSLTGLDPAMVAYYRLDESSGTTANDSSGNQRGGVLINSPAWILSTAPLLPLQVGISGFAPSFGKTGASITITGTNFLSLTSVLFNGVSASFVTNSNSTITATVPNGATTGPIMVSNGAGNATTTNFFIVDNAPPDTVFLAPAGVAFVKAISNLMVMATDSSPGSGVGTVSFYLERVSDGNFWTGTGWGVPTALPATQAGNLWQRNSGLPSASNLADGAYTIYAAASDNAGNSVLLNLGVTVDKSFAIIPISRLGNGQMQTHFPGIPGRNYRIQASTNLSTWTDIGAVTCDSSGIVQFQDANAPQFSRRFYRSLSP